MNYSINYVLSVFAVYIFIHFYIFALTYLVIWTGTCLAELTLTLDVLPWAVITGSTYFLVHWLLNLQVPETVCRFQMIMVNDKNCMIKHANMTATLLPLTHITISAWLEEMRHLMFVLNILSGHHNHFRATFFLLLKFLSSEKLKGTFQTLANNNLLRKDKAFSWLKCSIILFYIIQVFISLVKPWCVFLHTNK